MVLFRLATARIAVPKEEVLDNLNSQQSPEEMRALKYGDPPRMMLGLPCRQLADQGLISRALPVWYLLRGPCLSSALVVLH